MGWKYLLKILRPESKKNTTKLTDLSAPDFSHITNFLTLQDLLNLRVTCIKMFDMVMVMAQNKLVIALDLKVDDYHQIRKFSRNPRVYIPLDIRVDVTKFDKIGLEEENFLKEFESRICDVDYVNKVDGHGEKIKFILPEASKLKLEIGYGKSVSAEEVSILNYETLANL